MVGGSLFDRGVVASADPPAESSEGDDVAACRCDPPGDAATANATPPPTSASADTTRIRTFLADERWGGFVRRVEVLWADRRVEVLLADDRAEPRQVDPMVKPPWVDPRMEGSRGGQRPARHLRHHCRAATSAEARVGPLPGPWGGRPTRMLDKVRGLQARGGRVRRAGQPQSGSSVP